MNFYSAAKEMIKICNFILTLKKQIFKMLHWHHDTLFLLTGRFGVLRQDNTMHFQMVLLQKYS